MTEENYTIKSFLLLSDARKNYAYLIRRMFIGGLFAFFFYYPDPMASESVKQAWETINEQKGGINIFITSIVLGATAALVLLRFAYLRLLKYPLAENIHDKVISFISYIFSTISMLFKTFGSLLLSSKFVILLIRHFALLFEEFISVFRGASSLACGVFLYALFANAEGKIISALSVYLGLMIYETTFLTPRFIHMLKNLKTRKFKSKFFKKDESQQSNSESNIDEELENKEVSVQ